MLLKKGLRGKPTKVLTAAKPGRLRLITGSDQRILSLEGSDAEFTELAYQLLCHVPVSELRKHEGLRGLAQNHMSR